MRNKGRCGNATCTKKKKVGQEKGFNQKSNIRSVKAEVEFLFLIDFIFLASITIVNCAKK